MGIRYGNQPAIVERFDSTGLDSSIWTPFGLEHGTIDIVNGECVISNTTGGSADEIGIYSNISFPVGMTLVVRSKNTVGRHASLVGFGGPPYEPYPHGGTTTGLTIYSRADNVTSTGSYRDELGTTSTISPTQNLKEYQTFLLKRVTSTNVEVYRNGVLEWNVSTATFANSYPVYFSADGWSPTTTIVIDWVIVSE